MKTVKLKGWTTDLALILIAGSQFKVTFKGTLAGPVAGPFQVAGCIRWVGEPWESCGERRTLANNTSRVSLRLRENIAVGGGVEMRRLLFDGLRCVLDGGVNSFVGPIVSCVRPCVSFSVGSFSLCGCTTRP